MIISLFWRNDLLTFFSTFSFFARQTIDLRIHGGSRMSRKSEFLRKRERMEITLSTVLEYCVTSRKIKSCSDKTLVAQRSTTVYSLTPTT